MIELLFLLTIWVCSIAAMWWLDTSSQNEIEKGWEA